MNNEEKSLKQRRGTFRGIIYAMGMLSLALGIILNTKTGIGCAPISSPSYALAEIMGWNFSNVILVAYVLFAIAEYIIKGKNFRLYDLLQIPVSIVFTRCMNFFSNAIILQPDNFVESVIIAVTGCAFTAIGLSLSVSMRLVPNTGDGIVQALADRLGKNLGLMKNFFDIFCIVTAIIIGFAFEGRLVGIGVGTVIAMVLTGRFVYLFNRFCLAPFIKLAFGEPKA